MPEKNLKGFLEVNNLSLFKAIGNTQDQICYCPLRDKDESIRLELARGLVAQLADLGVDAIIGSYPPTSDNMAVIVTEGHEHLSDIGVLKMLAGETLLGTVRKENIAEKTAVEKTAVSR